MIKNILICVLVGIVIFLIGLLFGVVSINGLSIVPASGSINLTYNDLVAVILTVFSVFIGLGSVILAVAGFIGWHSIERKSQEVARGTIEKSISDRDSELHKSLRESVEKFAFEGTQGFQDDEDEPNGE